MLARVTVQGHHRMFQHFITHTTWGWDPVWHRLVELLPACVGHMPSTPTT